MRRIDCSIQLKRVDCFLICLMDSVNRVGLMKLMRFCEPLRGIVFLLDSLGIVV
jgi:hypothetical protein